MLTWVAPSLLGPPGLRGRNGISYSLLEDVALGQDFANQDGHLVGGRTVRAAQQVVLRLDRRQVQVRVLVRRTGVQEVVDRVHAGVQAIRGIERDRAGRSRAGGRRGRSEDTAVAPGLVDLPEPIALRDV